MQELEDIYDILEGELVELIYKRESAGPAWPGPSMLQADVRRTRAAVGTLSALMRAGYAWRPAEDGHEAQQWRAIVLELAQVGPEIDRMLRRELDEFVALARPGSRRALPPPGSFERLAREAYVDRFSCCRWARTFGTERVAGWRSCTYHVDLLRIARFLGATTSELVRAVCMAMRDAEPDVRAGMDDLLTVGIRDGEPGLAANEARIVTLRDRLMDATDHDRSRVDLAMGLSTLARAAAGGGIGDLALRFAAEYAVRIAGAPALRACLETPALLQRLESGARA